ncbi:MAG: hypothetical protein CBD56_01255 [Candidatus Pelagibacter sp. TMED196]|nr:MAG: hypothetical protein CBD56_01255 [Candidatus Pelagibacter sp. TMED196]|tara:strand:- start:2176 stop:3225 length:1050 start_codon:yes stop_codon:yes gene_type:complete
MKKLVVLFLIIIFFSKTQNVFASTGLFTVDNIEVDGPIKTLNNRDKYLNLAFKKGFRKLITSIIKREDQKEILSTDLSNIKSFISSYRIIEEKNFQNNYNLKINLYFNRRMIEKFLINKNISYSEMKKFDMLIYPIFIMGSELQVISKNKFYEEWNAKNIYDNVNFILPLQNLDDINFIKENLSNLEETDLSRLVDIYEIKNSTIIILRFNKKKLDVFLKSDLSGSKRNKKIDFKIDNLDNETIRGDIISNLKSYTIELWKEENLIDIATPSYLTLNIKIKNEESFKKIIDIIKKVNAIDSFSILNFDKKSARIKIKFFGKIKSLQNNLMENGFDVEFLDDQWNLKLSS